MLRALCCLAALSAADGYASLSRRAIAPRVVRPVTMLTGAEQAELGNTLDEIKLLKAQLEEAAKQAEIAKLEAQLAQFNSPAPEPLVAAAASSPEPIAAAAEPIAAAAEPIAAFVPEPVAAVVQAAAPIVESMPVVRAACTTLWCSCHLRHPFNQRRPIADARKSNSYLGCDAESPPLPPPSPAMQHLTRARHTHTSR